MREITRVNSGWFYRADFKDEYLNWNPEKDDKDWDEVCLPHTNKVLPYNGFDEKEYQFISTYRRQIFIDESLKDKVVLLHFEAVMTACTVWINGHPAGEHLGGYNGFDIDMTPHMTIGRVNSIIVKVDSRELENIPPFGKVVDFLTYGGIYREVSLITVNPLHISNMKIESDDTLQDIKKLKTRLFLENRNTVAGDYTIRLSLYDRENKQLYRKMENIDLPAEEQTVLITMGDLAGLQLWEPESPVLYRLEAEILDKGKIIDRLGSKFGFRTAEFKAEGFFLNGRHLKIRGLNRHQSFPYAGYAMPWRAQKKDADILKYELGLNLVRTSHYPQSRHFLDRCDEIGLLVFEEIPGWQHIGDKEWQDNACVMVEEMIRRDWNRPSVIIWGVRINESEDNHDFYSRTNRIARELDGTRQTGGVRYMEKSEFLEDVYTMNDFIHAGGRTILRTRKKATGKKNIPYLVTEHSGHMYPTKRFDQEERLQEKALRHMKILNQANGSKEISGAIGWCAFDYNTHREFGSGDRICYHGVSDMFRIPKYSAAVYASQLPPDDKIILEAASLFSKGERSAARILPIYVYTNCDYIKLYKNGRELGNYFPEVKEFPHLDHAPVIIRDLVGNQLKDSQFSPRDSKIIRKLMGFVMIKGEEALRWYHYVLLGWLMKKYNMKYSDMVSLFMKFTSGWGESEDIFEIAGFHNGEEAVRRIYGSGHAEKLTIQADDAKLNSGDWDTTRVEFRLVDQYGNIMPFVNEFIEFDLDGPGEIIGPEKTALAGGVISAWIRTTGKPGTITLKGRCSRFTSDEISISVV